MTENHLFNKVYVEICNFCNLSCSFCHGTKRKKTFMSAEDFEIAAKKAREFSAYIYLHIMGEPLMHPQLQRILQICSELDYKTCITTNGTLIKEKSKLLLSEKIYKINISLHSYEANNRDMTLGEYIKDICTFSIKAAGNGTLCSLRLWNGNGENALNGEIYTLLQKYIGGDFKKSRSGLILAKNIYLEYADKFDWPDLSADKKTVSFCMGLRDQIGILCDGTVVPCCLDCEGDIPLGNIFSEDLGDIINSPRAKAVYDGFSRSKPSEELCRHCGYAERFG